MESFVDVAQIDSFKQVLPYEVVGMTEFTAQLTSQEDHFLQTRFLIQAYNAVQYYDGLKFNLLHILKFKFNIDVNRMLESKNIIECSIYRGFQNINSLQSLLWWVYDLLPDSIIANNCKVLERGGYLPKFFFKNLSQLQQVLDAVFDESASNCQSSQASIQVGYVSDSTDTNQDVNEESYIKSLQKRRKLNSTVDSMLMRVRNQYLIKSSNIEKNHQGKMIL